MDELHPLREKRRFREARAAIGWLTLAKPIDETTEEYQRLRGEDNSVYTADGGFKVNPANYVSPGGPETLVCNFYVKGLTIWPEFVWRLFGQVHSVENEVAMRQQGQSRGVTFTKSSMQWRWSNVSDISGADILREIRIKLAQMVRG